MFQQFSQRILGLCCASLLAFIGLTTQAASADTWRDDAEAAALALGAQLKARLQAAMQSGGPIAAVDVCHEEAPRLAAQVSEATGFSVGRVSAKPRNTTQGAASSWQLAVLEQFSQQLAAGASPASLEWHDQAGGEQRYMKGIATEAVCLACHGSELSPAIAAAIAAKYPGDRATGYAIGDLRGAFVVTRPQTGGE